MRLGDLLKGVDLIDLTGDPELPIRGVTYDSRSVKRGDLFVALKGHALDGHRFLPQAARGGAVALMAENFRGVEDHPCRIRVVNSRLALSRLAVSYYDRPFADLNLIGITGTNGKTTTSYLTESILTAAGAITGVVGTIDCHFSGRRLKAPVTTPESLDLMAILRQMADAGVTDVAMEVSSHALDQERTRECPFRVAVFTNLSRDHLDYHGTMEAYFEAKSRLFRRLREKGGDGAKAVINMDDPCGERLAGVTDAEVVTYGMKTDCEVRAEGVRITGEGICGRLITPSGEAEIRSSLIGDFNVYNMLAASAAAFSLGIDPDTIAKGVSLLSGVPGRLERVGNRRSLSILVDYAHTPDALQKVLRAVRPTVRGRLITVFGCGGDRDRGKRGEMGRVAGEKSDLVFLTTDNPRTEDPEAIAAEIEEGLRVSGLRKLGNGAMGKEARSGYFVVLDRAQAIDRAVRISRRDDLILIAGKGHEDYQIIGRERREFDDRIVAARAAAGEN